eukprot:TRINITY_DN59283_c0_g1_i1.p2 TRINITY_DN59283_c0_g1~~TRINITY_DN59283_c0_g1_i1.p2  ORF type:complete len:135 (-),score=33.64 TRINITY_DN59283_c0_g1_i1:70-474(-)
MKAAGASRIVALVKEDVGTEVADFRKDFWSGEVMLDGEKAFFAALGGGKVWKPFSLASFLAMMLNPFSKAKSKMNIQDVQKVGTKGNMTGEGFVHGGTYVLRADGTPTYSYLEGEIGEHPLIEDVVRAIGEAKA